MKVLIIRYGAYGDIIHASHLPRLLKDQGVKELHVETNWKGYQLLKYNPFIDNIWMNEMPKGIPAKTVEQHWQILGDNYDKVINLYGSLEYGMLAMEDTDAYYMSDAVRRGRYGIANYYDASTIKAGYPHLIGCYLGEIFYPKYEYEIVENVYNDKFKDKFSVMINLCGTGYHKEFIHAKEVAQAILDKYPDSIIITTGDQAYKYMDFTEKDRVFSLIDKGWPFRQALLFARFVSCVITCESGIGVGSSMWGTPTIQLMTAASVKNHCDMAKNDFSLQSEAYCSPCHKGPYQYRGCPMKNDKLLCVDFPVERVIIQVDKIRQLYDKGIERTY